jgi:hypothetical protein
VAVELKAQTTDEIEKTGGIEKSPPETDALSHHASHRIEMLATSALKPFKRNARTHSRKQIRQIADSIRHFGFINPVLIDEAGQIIAGHGRVEAAKSLGMSEVPTIRLEHMSDAEKRAYIIADNRLAEKAGWDREILVTELEYLIDSQLDVEVIGFDPGEIEIVLNDVDKAEREAAAPEDEVPALVMGPAVTRPADLWQLGNHRIACGDSGQNTAYDLLLGSEKAEFVFSAPRSIAIEGNVSGDGSIHYGELAMAGGGMTAEALTKYLASVFHQLLAHSKDGSTHQIFIDWRRMGEVLAAGQCAYAELKDLCVCVKKNAGMGSFHELGFVWKSGTEPHIHGFKLGQHGHGRIVWEYPVGMEPAHLERPAMRQAHKPIALVIDALKDFSRRNGVVLDPFAGSGVTIMAAEQCGRRARGIEIDPLYVDVAVRRWQTSTGKVAILAATGQSFAEVEETRASAALPAIGAGPDREAA